MIALDPLHVAFALLAVVLPDPLGGAAERRARTLAWLCRGALAGAALAGPTWGQMIALAVALGLLGRLDRAAALRRGPVWLLLLPLAIPGVFDARPVPGQPVVALPLWAVACALAAVGAALGVPWSRSALARRRVNTELDDSSLADPSPSPAPWLQTLFTVVATLPLLTSLAAGPWDATARFVALGVGFALLVGAGWAAWRARDADQALAALRACWLGGLALALGSGSPEAVGGALLVGASALIGTACLGAGGLLRGLGLAALGLPPLLGFSGLWLALGGLAAMRLPLAVVALPAVTGLVAWALARTVSPAGRTRPAAGVLAGGLLLGSLVAPGVVRVGLPWLLNPLAAGLPALAAVRDAPGLGLLTLRANELTGSWPVVGVAAALLITLAGAEAAARLSGLLAWRSR